MKIILATHNDNKLREIRKIFSNTDVEFVSLKEIGFFDEIEERYIKTFGQLKQRGNPYRLFSSYFLKNVFVNQCCFSYIFFVSLFFLSCNCFCLLFQITLQRYCFFLTYANIHVIFCFLLTRPFADSDA